jgi:DNA processing protein
MSSITQFTQSEFSEHPLLKRLLELDQIPEVMYLRGVLPKFTQDTHGRLSPRILTIVGSRKHSEYGRIALEKIIRELHARTDIVILSGLALGIDSIAHKEALKHTIKTWAIPGSGIDDEVIYPSQHRHLAKEILANGGALLSELQPKTKAAQWTFPARNRIMAALSDAVLIVEAEEKSGTLITARLSLELGKDIGVIPGEITSPTSSGTNKLLRDGAYCITCAEDLLDLLHVEHQKKEVGTTDSIDTHLLTNEEKLLLEILRAPLDRDELLERSKLPLSSFLTTLSSLELRGYIQETFGEVRKVV